MSIEPIAIPYKCIELLRQMRTYSSILLLASLNSSLSVAVVRVAEPVCICTTDSLQHRYCRRIIACCWILASRSWCLFFLPRKLGHHQEAGTSRGGRNLRGRCFRKYVNNRIDSTSYSRVCNTSNQVCKVSTVSPNIRPMGSPIISRRQRQNRCPPDERVVINNEQN